MAQLKPWTTLPGLEMVGMSRSQRVLEILDCVAIEVLGGASRAQSVLNLPNSDVVIRKELAHMVVDVSQNPSRRAFSNFHGISKCLTTASTLYAFSRDRRVTGFEKMLIQGHPESIKIPESMTERSLNNLAGMGICLPSLGCIIVAMMCTTGL